MLVVLHVALYLVRHAKAGDRRQWKGPGPDHRRPLSKKGRRQAQDLADALRRELGAARPRIVSSPLARCVETVQPLAEALGVDVETDPVLAEGADPAGAVKLLRELAGTTAVLCSHRDLIPEILTRLGHEDGLELPADIPFAKGSTWVLEAEGHHAGDGRVARARYLPPPG